MELQSLTPATQAVLKALVELGQGNVHELAEKSGKARSTTDKAIRTLSDAGLIVEVDPDADADAAEGTPARWTLSQDTAAALESSELSDASAAGPDQTDDDQGTDPADEATTDDGDPAGDDDSQTSQTGDLGDDVAGEQKTFDDADDPDDDDVDDADDTGAPDQSEPRTTVLAPTRPGDRKVMAIKGVLADHSDGATIEVIVAESGISHPTTIRLLAAMEQADAARRKPDLPQRWIAGPTKASDVDPNPEPPRCALCLQVIRGVASTPAAVAAVHSLIRPDGTLHVVGTDDEVHVVTLPTRRPPRSLNTSPSTRGHRSDITVNTDGNQPFGRGELEKLTVAVLADNPGRPMTPQEIATAISAKLGGRTVSSGAVRNNCTKAAAAGNILLVSDAPLTFVFPPPPVSDNTAEDGTDAEQPDTGDTGGDGDDRAEQSDSDQDAGSTQQP